MPLVVAANTCGATPDWPSKMMVPTPQPTLLGAAMARPRGDNVSRVAMISLFFMISFSFVRWTDRYVSTSCTACLIKGTTRFVKHNAAHGLVFLASVSFFLLSLLLFCCVLF